MSNQCGCRVVGATLYVPGKVYGIVGVCDGPRAVLGVGFVHVPYGVGAFGGRLSNVAQKLARSKALRAVAKTAVKTAQRSTGTQAASALAIAQKAMRESDALELSARREQDRGLPAEDDYEDEDENV